MTISAVLVDLDGTLLHTAPDLAAAANRMLAELGMPAREPEVVATFIGKGVPTLVRRTLADTDDEALLERALALFERYYAEESGARTQPFPRALDGLIRLRALGLPLACVTNKPERFTRELLERAGFAAFFEVLVCGDTVSRKKPDPMPVVFACERLGVQPKNALFIGDSLNDVAAARAAGCPVWCVPYGYNEGRAAATLDCDRLVADLDEAAQLIAGLSSPDGKRKPRRARRGSAPPGCRSRPRDGRSRTGR